MKFKNFYKNSCSTFVSFNLSMKYPATFAPSLSKYHPCYPVCVCARILLCIYYNKVSQAFSRISGMGFRFSGIWVRENAAD